MVSSKPLGTLLTLLMLGSGIQCTADNSGAPRALPPVQETPPGQPAPAAPDHPVRLGRHGDLLLVLSSAGGLELVDVSNQEAPVHRLRVPLQGRPVWVGAEGNTVLAWMDQVSSAPSLPSGLTSAGVVPPLVGGQLLQVDVSNPAAPVLVQRLDTGAGALGVAVVNHVLVVASAEAAFTYGPDGRGMYAFLDHLMWPPAGGAATVVAFSQTAAMAFLPSNGGTLMAVTYPGSDGVLASGGSLHVAGRVLEQGHVEVTNTTIHLAAVDAPAHAVHAHDVVLGGVAPVQLKTWRVEPTGVVEKAMRSKDGLLMALPGSLVAAAEPSVGGVVVPWVDQGTWDAILDIQRTFVGSLVALVASGANLRLLNFQGPEMQAADQEQHGIPNAAAGTGRGPVLASSLQQPRLVVSWPSSTRGKDDLEVVDLGPSGFRVAPRRLAPRMTDTLLDLGALDLVLASSRELEVVHVTVEEPSFRALLRRDVFDVALLGSGHTVLLQGDRVAGNILLQVVEGTNADGKVVGSVPLAIPWGELVVRGNWAWVVGAINSPDRTTTVAPGQPQWRTVVQRVDLSIPANPQVVPQPLRLDGAAFHAIKDAPSFRGGSRQRFSRTQDTLVFLRSSTKSVSTSGTGCACASRSLVEVEVVHALVVDLSAEGPPQLAADVEWEVGVDMPEPWREEHALLAAIAGTRPDADGGMGTSVELTRLQLLNPAGPNVDVLQKSVLGSMALGVTPGAFFVAVLKTPGGSAAPTLEVTRVGAEGTGSALPVSLANPTVPVDAVASSKDLLWVLQVAPGVDRTAALRTVPLELTAADYRQEPPRLVTVPVPPDTLQLEMVDASRVLVRTSSAVFLLRLLEGGMVGQEAVFPSDDVPASALVEGGVLRVATGASGVQAVTLAP